MFFLWHRPVLRKVHPEKVLGSAGSGPAGGPLGVWEVTMRKLWAWGLATVLCAGLAASNAWAKDDDDDDSSQAKPPPRPAIRWSHYFAGMETYSQPKPETAKPAAKPKKQTSKTPVEKPPPKNPAHEAASERAREEAILMRRLEVCDKLKEIALPTNDGELFRRAEVLDE